MRDAWKRCRLDELANIQGGGTPSRSDDSFFGGGIPWVTPTDLPGIGRVTALMRTKETLSVSGVQNSGARLIPPGSVLFSSRATIGKIAVTEFECATNQGFINLTPYPERIRPWFLAFLLSHHTPSLIHLAGKTTFLEIPRGKIKGYEVEIPDLVEQDRLVSKIREGSARIEEIERLRNEVLEEREFLVESLVDAKLASAKGVCVRLGDVSAISSKLVDPRLPEFKHHAHVGGANIESKTGRLINVRTAEEENLKSAKFVFDDSMVLYNKIRPYLMKVARPDFSGLCSADMYPLAPKRDRLSRDYLFYVLMSRNFTGYAIDGSNRAGMPKVNREHLFAHEFCLPSLETQGLIAQELDGALGAVLVLDEEMTTSSRGLAPLRGSFLRKAFCGEM